MRTFRLAGEEPRERPPPLDAAGPSGLPAASAGQDGLGHEVETARGRGLRWWPASRCRTRSRPWPAPRPLAACGGSASRLPVLQPAVGRPVFGPSASASCDARPALPRAAQSRVPPLPSVAGQVANLPWMVAWRLRRFACGLAAAGFDGPAAGSSVASRRLAWATVRCPCLINRLANDSAEVGFPASATLPTEAGDRPRRQQLLLFQEVEESLGGNHDCTCGVDRPVIS